MNNINSKGRVFKEEWTPRSIIKRKLYSIYDHENSRRIKADEGCPSWEWSNAFVEARCHQYYERLLKQDINKLRKQYGLNVIPMRSKNWYDTNFVLAGVPELRHARLV